MAGGERERETKLDISMSERSSEQKNADWTDATVTVLMNSDQTELNK